MADESPNGPHGAAGLPRPAIGDLENALRPPLQCAAFKAAHPDLYAQFIQFSETRVFRLKSTDLLKGDGTMTTQALKAAVSGEPQPPLARLSQRTESPICSTSKRRPSKSSFRPILTQSGCSKSRRLPRPPRRSSWNATSRA